MEVIDISDKENPETVNLIKKVRDIHDVFVSIFNYAYLADKDGYLHVLDVFDLQSPEILGSLHVGGTPFQVAMSFSQNQAYLACAANGLQVADISDLTDLEEAGSYETKDLTENVTVSGDFAYLCNKSHGLQIIDISDPATPETVGDYQTQGWPEDVAVSGVYAYVAMGYEGVVIVDLNNPEFPDSVTSLDMLGVNAVAVSGHYLYVADDMTFRSFDITDRSSPNEVASSDVASDILHFVLSGDYAYLATRQDGLQIKDISSPDFIADAATVSAAEAINSVAIAGNYAYLALESAGLLIVDISNPEAPRTKGSYGGPGRWSGVAVSNNYAYLTKRDTVVMMLDVSDPLSPQPAGYFDTGSAPERLTTADNMIFVADNWDGLYILRNTLATDVQAQNTPNLKEFTLCDNYPNPFNACTTLEYEMPASGHVEVAVYNLTGQRIRMLMNQMQSAGRHRIIWDGKTDSGNETGSGVYIVRMLSGPYKGSQKIIMMK